MFDQLRAMIAMPSFDGTVDVGAARAVMLQHGLGHPVVFAPSICSLLAHGFNKLWAKALQQRLDFFMMVHADVVPEPGWAAKLEKLLAERDADVVSCVIPIKGSPGLTSTAIGDPNDPWDVVKRLTLKEVGSLPETFTAAEAGHPDRILLVNTGCWIADIRKPWARATRSNGELRAFFTIRDRILYEPRTETYRIQLQPEDWSFSRMLHEMGCTVVATKAIRIGHVGRNCWRSDAYDTGVEHDTKGARARWAADEKLREKWQRAFAGSCT